MTTRRRAGSLTAAVKSDLAELAKRLPGVEQTTEAQIAVAMARDVEDPGNSLTSRTMAARVLLDAMAAAGSAAPAEQTADRLDELTARRATRRAAS